MLNSVTTVTYNFLHFRLNYSYCFVAKNSTAQYYIIGPEFYIAFQKELTLYLALTLMLITFWI